MQSETYREVKFAEPNVAPEVELRVDKVDVVDGPLEQLDNAVPPVPGITQSSADVAESSADSTEHSAHIQDSGAAIADSTVSPPSSESKYLAIAASFGPSHQVPRQSFGPAWECNVKQAFNTAYFTVATAAIVIVCLSWKLPVLWLAVAMSGMIAIAALRGVWNNRAYPADFAVRLSKNTRLSLRATALLLPIPFFAILLAQPIAQGQLKQGQALFHDGKYKDALTHLNLAATLDPVMEEAYMELADCYNFSHDYKSSLTNAEKALQLDPTDGAAWASKAWALNSQNKFAEALPAALTAVKFSPESGQANHALADAYVNLGDYEKALAPASEHIQIHDTESGALDLRASILDKLGRGDEAAADRAASEKLRQEQATESADESTASANSDKDSN